MFHGVTIGSSGIHLSHLFYVDDVTILSEWNQNDMENIMRMLNIIYIAYDLKINIHKSNVFGVGVSNKEIVSMAACTGCEPGSYGSFKARMLGWKANLPSIGRHLTLIKSVLGSLGIYYLSIFKVPEIVVKSLESLRVAFFWGVHEDTKKIVWVKWSNILASLDKGGLGVGSLKSFSKALLLKWRWRLFQNPNALWVHVVKAIHGDKAGVDIRGCQTNKVWASIVGMINHLYSSGIVPLKSIRFKVGDGSSIHFLKDTWLGDEPICIRYNRLFHLANIKDCFIRQRIVNGSWDWDWSRPITMGRTKTKFDNLILDTASLESYEIVGSDSC
ncbi:hypothetical protein Tco_0763448, partial [Tanacetum coccineum]